MTSKKLNQHLFSPVALSVVLQTMAKLVKPGGTLVTLIFPVVEKQGGPPFQVDIAEMRGILERNGFENCLLEPIAPEKSHKGRGGQEHLGVWKRKLE